MESILKILETRFKNNMHRHPNVSWDIVVKMIEKDPSKIESLSNMEKTGGEPDVIFYDPDHAKLIFMDCSKETPKGRRSLCYDNDALIGRKKFPPKDSALNLSETMGVELLNQEDYLYLQTLEPVDLKTSSWILTPKEIRELGGALFCDNRYNKVFTYHNGADSYYEARGFRTKLVFVER
ncbi:conserved hypothetical protein [Alteracholeplasma palmae J233]|uniref:DUF4256 domain-containing protein n=1 Tax=Alteracholeplasma palmae (strain ATCC 49389 / J233) TaxID=1318466 RepID=U4KL34_ALTPJ|nr:DUF4256 domain-containing protein [Alteracholeplasma palmae]CCV64433.1 conserved hypothetical protein [Alteracholeplasma palmae J233]